MLNKNKIFLPLTCVLICCCSKAGARFAAPTYAPVDRLLRNAAAFVRENPENPYGYYTLARIHYLAFADKAFLVAITNPDSTPPQIAPDWLRGDYIARVRDQHARKLALDEMGYKADADVPQQQKKRFYALYSQKRDQLLKQNWLPPQPTDPELVQHAAAALQYFEKAIQLDDENGLYHLGLASLLEQYVQFLQQAHDDIVPQPFRKVILEQARRAYKSAYDLSIRKDLKHKYRPIAGLGSLVGYEAGKAFIRLAEADKNLPEADKKQLAATRKNITKLENLKRNMVTPVIFSFQPHNGPAELIAPQTHVRFDLDGDGVARLWPWVKPTTAILVWDPHRTGRVTSGRQLFGSVTWWLFFSTGYEALGLLDDDRDGKLTGPELTGISAWFDRNSNGRCEPDEVVPLTRLQIESISVAPVCFEQGLAMVPDGLTTKDGRTLTTYDWSPSPIDSSASAIAFDRH